MGTVVDSPGRHELGPLFSAFEIGNGTSDSLHFQTQLSDESIIAESYYNLNNAGFGSLYKLPIQTPDGYAPFGPGYKQDPRNMPLRHGRHEDGRGVYISFPFSPFGIQAFTPFVRKGDWPSLPAVLGKKDSPRLGLFTHPFARQTIICSPSGRRVRSTITPSTRPDSTRESISSSRVRRIDDPGQMMLIKNDPKYQEQWPRAWFRTAHLWRR